jgi:chromosomal replication initiation ATPase DnaA
MINLIYGLKGSGKTEKIIAAANERAQSSKGCVLYITDRKEHSLSVSRKVRFIDITAWGIKCENCFVPFLKGLLASNYDVTDVFIDGLAKFIGKDVSELEEIFKKIDLLSCEHKVDFTLTVSAEEVPDFMKKYL